MGANSTTAVRRGRADKRPDLTAAELSARIAAQLEAAPGASEEAPQSPEGPGPSPTPPDAGGGPETLTERRSWWRRLLEG